MVPGVSEGKPEKSPSHLYSQTRVENLLFLYFLCPPPRGFYQNAVATAAAAAGPLGKNLLVGVDLLNINLDCRVIE